VPAQPRGGLTLGGKLGCRSLHLAGTGSKMTGASGGTLQLRDGTLAKGERLLVSGVTGAIVFFRAARVFAPKGGSGFPEPRPRRCLKSLTPL